MSMRLMKGFAKKAGFEGVDKIRTKRKMRNFLNREIKKQIEEENRPPAEEEIPIHPLTKRWQEYELEKELKTKNPYRERRIRQKLAALRGRKLEKMFNEKASSLQGYAKELVAKNEEFLGTPKDFFRAIHLDLEKVLNSNRNNRVKCVLSCVMERTNLEGEVVQTVAAFHSQMERVLEGDNVGRIVRKMQERMLENFANFLQRGSNWTFVRVEEFKLFLAHYRPLRGSTYLELPPALKKKKAVVNMKNNDSCCFKWAVGRALNPVPKDPQRIDKNLRRKCEDLNFDGITFPVSLKDIDKFEKNNPEISVNVFGWEKHQTIPLRISGSSGSLPVDLMLITKSKSAPDVAGKFNVQRLGHYCWISNLSRLLSFQVKRRNGRVSICRRCLNAFTEKQLEIHSRQCGEFESVRIDMPEEGTVLKWKNYQRKQKLPFAIYADFEARLIPVSGAEPEPNESFTEKFQKHVPVSFAFNVVSKVFKRKLTLYRAETNEENIGDKFVEELTDAVREIQNAVKWPKKMKFYAEDKEKFKNATACWICEEDFKDEDKKVRDHCHFTGKFRGAAHESCNLQCRKPKFTPVFFHNLKGYDAHFIVKALGKIPGEIKCLANNEEKYISFSKMINVGEWIDKNGKLRIDWHEIRFLDSAGFMAGTLEVLAKHLTDENLIETKKVFGEDWELAKQKGVFPYEWLNSVERFKEILPEKDKFYSQLNEEGISEKDYEHAWEVWKRCKMKNMGDYHDFYLKSDVCLLSDVFEEFRKVCKRHYGLDPAWFYTSPGLAWDSALKESKVELELLSDPNMLIFFENGIRGGVSTIFHRRATANNKYMKNFDKTKPSVFIPYWDANGLYAWAMIHPLPVGKFEWMSESELKDWQNYSCILEVDVDIPEELHEKFNVFPPSPERKTMGGVEKLIPNLWNKRDMICHWKILKQAVALGCVLKKVKRGIKFKEEAWLKSFIDKNVILRQKSKNAFEKDFFKLMNNAVFGKTMENIRKRKKYSAGKLRS